MTLRFRRRSQIEKQPQQPWDSLDPPQDRAIEMIYRGRGVGASLFSNAAAVQDGATTEWIARNQGVIVLDSREVIVDGSVLNESSLGATICNDKALTKKFLVAMGVRTPHGRIARSAADAVSAAGELLGAVVVKPVGGGMGSGVTVGPQGGHELREAYHLAAGSRRRQVLVEELVDIESEYRCMATRQECVSVIERVLPSVVGDGESTVRDLVRKKNEDRARNPGIHNLPIPIDNVAHSTLGRQGLDVDSVPIGGEKVLVRNVGGLSGGGEPIDRFDQVSWEVMSLAHRAIQAIPSLSWGGVDVVIERDTGVPFVVEINTQAGYGAATFPVRGKARDVASVAWRERLSMVQPEPPKCSDALKKSSEPRSVSSVGQSGQEAAGGSTLADFFFVWLGSQGYEVDREHKRVVRVNKHGKEIWLRSNAASSSDLLAVHRTVRRHDLVRLLLARKSVPRVRGRLMRDVMAFDRFFESQEGRFVALPKSSHWGNRRSVIVESREARKLLATRGTWVVQRYPAGTRMIVLATRTGTLAVLQRPDEAPVVPSTVAAACNVAVDAIRAIPELRWAAVDIIAGNVGDVSEDSSQVFVEGVNINRDLSGEELIIAGDIEDVYNFMVSS